MICLCLHNLHTIDLFGVFVCLFVFMLRFIFFFQLKKRENFEKKKERKQCVFVLFLVYIDCIHLMLFFLLENLVSGFSIDASCIEISGFVLDTSQ